MIASSDLLFGEMSDQVAEPGPAVTNKSMNFKEKLWELPGHRTKNGLTNLVPLNHQAIRVLEKQREGLEYQKQRREPGEKRHWKVASFFPAGTD